MIPELGHFALILRSSSRSAGRPADRWGAPQPPGLDRPRRPAAQVAALLISFAFGCLTWAFVANDFSVTYVANHSNSLLPIQYRISGYGRPRRLLLLWVLMLTWLALAVTFSLASCRKRWWRGSSVRSDWSRPASCSSSCSRPNPFDRLLPGAPEGRDLNPLLQDPGLVIHPPCSTWVTSVFSVAYAFAVAALALRPTRCCLGPLVAALDDRCLDLPDARHRHGSWWAYYELGWGGWWFWDPGRECLVHALAGRHGTGT